MNRDFAEMLSALSEAEVEYLVVGGYAVIAHGYPRATGDIDIWVRPTPENAEKVMLALRRFGAPLADLSAGDLVTPGLIFQIGDIGGNGADDSGVYLANLHALAVPEPGTLGLLATGLVVTSLRTLRRRR